MTPEMTQGEMDEILLTFSNTVQYQAVLKYLTMRDQLVTNGIRALDPFKQPTEIARNQGIGMGLMDLPEYIRLLKEKQVEAEKPTETK